MLYTVDLRPKPDATSFDPDKDSVELITPQGVSQEFTGVEIQAFAMFHNAFKVLDNFVPLSTTPKEHAQNLMSGYRAWSIVRADAAYEAALHLGLLT